MNHFKLIIILFTLLYMSCTSSRNSRTIILTDYNVTRAWLDTLERDKEKMRNEWINNSKYPVRLFVGSQYSDIYYGFDSLSALKECDIIPIETYMIDSLWKEKLKKNNDIPISELIHLTRERASFYAVKDQKFYYRVGMKKDNGNWILANYGPPPKSMSDSLSKVYFERKEKIIILHETRIVYYVLFYENNQLMNMRSDGQSTTLRSFLLERIAASKIGNHY